MAEYFRGSLPLFSHWTKFITPEFELIFPGEVINSSATGGWRKVENRWRMTSFGDYRWSWWPVNCAFLLVPDSGGQRDFAAALLLPHAAAMSEAVSGRHIGSLRQPNTSKCLQRQFSKIAAAIFDFAAAIFMHAAAVVLIVCGSLKVVCGNLGVTPRQCDIAAAIIQPCNGSRASGQRSLVGSNRSLDRTSLPVGTPREWSLITLRGALGPSTPTAFAVAFNGSRECNAQNWGNTYFRPTYLLPSALISSRRQISPQRRLHTGSSSSAPRQSNS
ncbi:hypothetical protein DFH09DRAFT_1073086 [Mycena vulgaris]|nr:hypothetical protein DFH09DRAFT_1073086 [Mycena vulgaris]